MADEEIPECFEVVEVPCPISGEVEMGYVSLIGDEVNISDEDLNRERKKVCDEIRAKQIDRLQRLDQAKEDATADYLLGRLRRTIGYAGVQQGNSQCPNLVARKKDAKARTGFDYDIKTKQLSLCVHIPRGTVPSLLQLNSRI